MIMLKYNLKNNKMINLILRLEAVLKIVKGKVYYKLVGRAIINLLLKILKRKKKLYYGKIKKVLRKYQIII